MQNWDARKRDPDAALPRNVAACVRDWPVLPKIGLVNYFFGGLLGFMGQYKRYCQEKEHIAKLRQQGGAEQCACT